MNGLMQDHPLNIPMILRHAERMHPHKTVTTRTEAGVVTARSTSSSSGHGAWSRRCARWA
jgi:hypothetical protein